MNEHGAAGAASGRGADEQRGTDDRGDALTVAAPAKLTLQLRVTGVRADGYHLIDAEMVSLAWADTLTIWPDGHGLTADGPFAAGMPLDDTNLVAKALRLAGRTAAVHMHKEIPHGGGLGGGSSDAAAVLRWAGYTDVSGASQLGADVSFCLVGGRARVRGIGEIVEPLPFQPMDITLVIPPLAVSTPAAYRAWDDLGGPRADGPNDLEPAALVVEPALARWRDRIREAAGTAPTLAGSGATWFLVGHHSVAAAFPEAVVVHTRTDRQQRAAGGR
ncbi:MAG: 4-(cytidine 5'-diphospho)-2-C-methyl-D-erythritol kinase [Actinomycetota bacterium]|nr:4-(cytidine 5'-diphospho)-2-C-methyl-D-erythritol kinase [Actinomycetota bacterium]